MQWKIFRVVQWMSMLGAKMTPGGQAVSKLDFVRMNTLCLFIVGEDFFPSKIILTKKKKKRCPYLQEPTMEACTRCQVNKDSLCFLPLNFFGFFNVSSLEKIILIHINPSLGLSNH